MENEIDIEKLRKEGMPFKIIVLKSRQVGMSTLKQDFFIEIQDKGTPSP